MGLAFLIFRKRYLLEADEQLGAGFGVMESSWIHWSLEAGLADSLILIIFYCYGLVLYCVVLVCVLVCALVQCFCYFRFVVMVDWYEKLAVICWDEAASSG